MDAMKEFKKLVKSLPEGQRARLPEKIRGVCNRPEHSDLLKAIALGTYLNLSDEISLTGYVGVSDDISSDEQYCTAVKDEKSGDMIIGKDEIKNNISLQDFRNTILYR